MNTELHFSQAVWISSHHSHGIDITHIRVYFPNTNICQLEVASVTSKKQMNGVQMQ
jgi:hypothetical protein